MYFGIWFPPSQTNCCGHKQRSNYIENLIILDVGGTYIQNELGQFEKLVDFRSKPEQYDQETRPNVPLGQLYTDEEFPLSVAMGNKYNRDTLKWKRPPVSITKHIEIKIFCVYYRKEESQSFIGFIQQKLNLVFSRYTILMNSLWTTEACFYE